MNRFFRSLRWRLQIWHGLILFFTIVALCVTVYQLASVDRYRRIDQELGRAERGLMRSLVDPLRPTASEGPPPGPETILSTLRAQPVEYFAPVLERFSGTESGYAYFIIKDSSGRVLLRSDNAPAARDLLPAGAGSFAPRFRTVDSFRESLRTSPEGLASLVGRDISAEQEFLTRFTWSLAATGLSLWLAGLIGGWWLAGRAIKPIDTISATASRIAAGNRRERIDPTGTDNELDQLSRVLNSTFDQLHTAFERQRRFTADAAHELRTPITILLTETQRILKRPREVEDYRQSLEICQTAAGRMRRLTEALLTLARQESIDPATPAMVCDLAALAAEAVSAVRPLAAQHHVTIDAELARATCRADGQSISILINNLVTNAIHHHHAAGGHVWVQTLTTERDVVLVVRDDGPGIPAEQRPHIFERFYRADQARTGGSEHTGLGLAIARAIATTHGGTLTVDCPPVGGTVFTATFPQSA